MLGVVCLGVATPSTHALSAETSEWAPRLGTQLEALLESTSSEGRLALYVREVTTGQEFALDADRSMYLSSALKLVVMVDVLRQVDAGALSLDDVLTLTAEDVRDGMHALGETPLGTQLNVGELLALMMESSDNAAADLLIGRVGVPSLNTELFRRGIRFGPLVSLLDERRRIYAELDPRADSLSPADIRALGVLNSLDARAELLSGLLHHVPAWTGVDLHHAFNDYYALGLNSAPMREVGRLLEQVALCEELSTTSCALAQSLLERCRTGKQRIRAGLPPGARWAHKTGTQHLRACDVGILEFETERPVVVAACTEGFGQVSEAETLLAGVGEALTQAFAPSLRARIDPPRSLGDEGFPTRKAQHAP